MKLKNLLVLVICLYAITLSAAPVSTYNARQVAENFWLANTGKTTIPSFQEVSGQFGFQQFYIFRNEAGKGYVIVAADDCVQPIIAYSLSNTFNYPLPAHVQAYLAAYEREIAFYKENNVQATEDIETLWTSLRNGNYTPRNTTSVAPLLTSIWGQQPYYNDLCPDSAGVHAVAGCAATATAQVMRYWEWPLTGTGYHSYVSGDFGLQSANFGATTYNWDLMPDALTYASLSSQINAVATLIYHVGVAIEMNYGLSESGAYVNSYGYPTLASSENALKEYFDYSSGIYSVYRDYDNISDANWVSILTTELDAGRPVIETGRDTSAGHAFVCDGYDNNGLFHINWGWRSAYDGYFAHNALNPGGGGTGSNMTYTFNESQTLLVGIEPNAYLRVNTHQLSFDQLGGTQSFVVKGSDATTLPWTITTDQPWLTVSPTAGPAGVETTVTASVPANNTGEVRTATITITQDDQVVTVEVQQNECLNSDMCAINLNMNDSYGDGWNNASVSILSESGFEYANATLSSGSALSTQYTVCPSMLIVIWHAGSNNGQWDSECSFSVTTVYGQTLLEAYAPSDEDSYIIPFPCEGLPNYTITAVAASSSTGYVTGGGMYPAGATIELRAFPAQNYYFAAWNDGNTENPRIVTVDANNTYIAYFVPSTAVEEVNLKDLNVYSFQNQIFVNHAEGMSIEIYNMLGQRVAYDENNSQASRIFSLNTAGMYLVKVGDAYFKKVIVR